MLKWTLQTFTLISVLHASIPIALSESGWFLLMPHFDEGLMAALEYVTAWANEPFEEKREMLLKNPPSTIRKEDFDRLNTIFQKMIRESSLQKRTEIFLDSALNTDTPLSKWKQIRTFDSATECEKLKQQVLVHAKEKLGDIETSELTEESFKNLQAVILIRSSRCVPASVVYPFMP